LTWRFLLSGADDDGETCTRVCLTGRLELLHNGAREEDSKGKRSANRHAGKKGKEESVLDGHGRV
jgi:hypothetical protein